MNDLRFALRQLRRRPGYALTTVLTLSLGIGATTTVFSVVNALLIRPLPVADPERLVNVIEVRETGSPRFSWSLPEYLAYRDAAGSLSGLAVHHVSDITLAISGEATVGLGMDVSGNYFDVLGVRPAAGRFFGEDEARAPGAAPVAVISYDVWQSRFGGDPDAVGQTLKVNGHQLTVIGVVPRGFHGAMLGARPSVWLPIGLQELFWPDRNLSGWGNSSWLSPIGRLAPGVTREAAEAALTVTARQLAASHDYPDGRPPSAIRLRTFTGVPPALHDGIVGFTRLLLATAGLVLLIAAVNVAGMFLARAMARRREIAVRLAVGATRPQVSRQLVVESVVLALLGGAGSVLVAVWTGGLLEKVRVPGAGSFVLEMTPDARVLGFAAAVSFLTGILCGLAPAIQVTGRGLFDALREGARAGSGRGRLRSVLVAAQIALSMVLLVAAGLFVRTLRTSLATDHGFDPSGVLAVELNLRLSGHDETRGRAFYAELLERLEGAPEVESAALASIVPLGLGWDQTRAQVPGHESPDESGFVVGFNLVTPGYFHTLDMPLLAGRPLAEEDRAGPAVIVVNQTFARRFWPDGTAVGRIVRFDGAETQIVGVVPDGKYQSFSEAPTLYAYAPSARVYRAEMYLHVRGAGELAPTVAAVRRELHRLDPDVAPISVAPLEGVLGSSLLPQRLAAVLIGAFGGLGLILAAVGVFGVLSFRVVQRTQEIGVRVALGARRRDVLALVLRDGLRLLLIGLAVGVTGALLTTRLFAGLLHGLSPTDPVTFVAVPALLAIVVVLAAYLPARRAARIDPMEALRYE